LSSPNPSTPQRGEIWLVNFDPTVGTEIQKTRPAVVVSSDAVGRLPIKLGANSRISLHRFPGMISGGGTQHANDTSL
jgi:hypothetical protein